MKGTQVEKYVESLLNTINIGNKTKNTELWNNSGSVRKNVRLSGFTHARLSQLDPMRIQTGGRIVLFVVVHVIVVVVIVY